MAISIPAIKLPFSTIADLPPKAQIQIRRNFEELQKNISGASTMFDAVIDGSLTTSVPASHTYKNLTDLVANETLSATKLFTVAVVGRPSSNIVETASITLNGSIALIAGGAVGGGGPASDGSRPIWDLHGFTVTGSSTYAITCSNLEIVNYSAGSVTTAFPNTAVYLDNCVVKASDSTGNSRRLTNIASSLFMLGGAIYDFGSPSTGRAWLYSVHWFISTLNQGTVYNPALNGDFYFIGGTIGKVASAGLGFTHTTTNRCYIDAHGLVNQTGFEGGSLTIPVAVTGTGDYVWKVAGTGGDNQLSLQFTIGAAAGNVNIDSDNINRLTCSGNSGNNIRSFRLRMKSTSGSTLDVTGPAWVDAEWSSTLTSTAQTVILRGAGVRANLRLGSWASNPWVALTACTDSVIVANLSPPSGAGAQAYAIDGSSARCILIINNQHANFTVASTNAGTNCLVINELGVLPAGAAGGSLAGTYPNPTFAGRDSSVDKINQDILPAALVGPAEGVATVPVPAPSPGGAAGGSLAGTYPNPTFAGRDSSVDKINQDLLPAALVGPGGVVTTPTPAPGSAPTGAAGGSLSGTYPNPVFAGRDSSVDKINQDMLPAWVSQLGPGMAMFPNPAGGSLAGSYPNPTFAGRDSSVDKINQDLLPAALVGLPGVVTTPAPAAAAAAATTDWATAFLLMGG